MAMARIVTVNFVLSLVFVLIGAQFQDDSDYNDLEFYGDLSFDYESFDKELPNSQDDFYIITGFDDSQPVDRYPSNDNHNLKKDRRDENWYRLPEKVYRYTKHRIPGYDYEELDYVGAGSFYRCDDRSVWTHCLCQFTCAQPDIVDCFTPCKSGCECKEDYVFDEITNTCSLPEECTHTQDFVYNK